MSASVLLKPFFNGNERCHTTESNSAFKCETSITTMIPGDRKIITTQWCSIRRHFTATIQALNIMKYPNKNNIITKALEICYLRRKPLVLVVYQGSPLCNLAGVQGMFAQSTDSCLCVVCERHARRPRNAESRAFP